MRRTSTSLTPRQRLEMFRDRAARLAASRLLREGLRPRLSLQFTTGDGLRRSLREPDEDLLRSFLLDFRPFVAEREPVFMFSIFNICERSIGNDEIRGYLRQAREYWLETHRSSGIVSRSTERRSPRSTSPISGSMATTFTVILTSTES